MTKYPRWCSRISKTKKIIRKSKAQTPWKLIRNLSWKKYFLMLYNKPRIESAREKERRTINFKRLWANLMSLIEIKWNMRNLLTLINRHSWTYLCLTSIFLRPFMRSFLRKSLLMLYQTIITQSCLQAGVQFLEIKVRASSKWKRAEILTLECLLLPNSLLSYPQVATEALLTLRVRHLL